MSGQEGRWSIFVTVFTDGRLLWMTPKPSCYDILQGAAKKWSHKVFRRFLSNRLRFLYEILLFYLKKTSTFNCQVKCDSVEKQQNYRLFNMTAY